MKYAVDAVTGKLGVTVTKALAPGGTLILYGILDRQSEFNPSPIDILRKVRCWHSFPSSGRRSLPLAKKLGTLPYYAVDVDPVVLERLKHKSTEESLTSILRCCYHFFFGDGAKSRNI